MLSLMMSGDLDIMMLEFAVEKLFIPNQSVFDAVVMKKTTVMFRMLDSDWTPVNPNRPDYVPYTGSSAEEANFHGGKSVVFAIPAGSLGTMMKDVDIQIHVIKEVSKYFEVNPAEERQNVGVALANVDRLFNGIIKDLREREELKEYLNCFHKRQPISRSLKETYDILDEEDRPTGATIGIYVRLSYLGRSVITEIDRDRGLRSTFYAQEETNEESPYQCRELEPSELSGGCWGSDEFSPPPSADRLRCRCDEFVTEEPTECIEGVENEINKPNEIKRPNEINKPNEIEQPNEMKKPNGTKKPNGGNAKTEKRVRKSRSADEKRRKSEPEGEKEAGGRKTLDETGGSESPGGQKRRGAARDKRVSSSSGGGGGNGDQRDRETIRKLDKESKPPTSENARRLFEQLRKRRGANVTVGIVDKKKNICPAASSTCPRQTALTTQRCPDFHASSCCYPQSYGCPPCSVPLSGCCAPNGD